MAMRGLGRQGCASASSAGRGPLLLPVDPSFFKTASLSGHNNGASQQEGVTSTVNKVTIMDLTTCTQLELWEFIEGFSAARRGEACFQHQTDYWQGGWMFWFQSAPDREAALAELKTIH